LHTKNNTIEEWSVYLYHRRRTPGHCTRTATDIGPLYSDRW